MRHATESTADEQFLAGQVQVMLNSMPTMLPHVKSGKLRELAVASVRRVKAVPDMASKWNKPVE